MTDLGPLIPRNREIHPAPYDPDYKTSVARSPNLPLLSMESGLSEETGPTFGQNKLGALDNNLILNWTKGAAPAVGERILMHGRVLDENNRPVPPYPGRNLASQRGRAVSPQTRYLFCTARSKFWGLWPHDHRRERLL